MTATSENDSQDKETAKSAATMPPNEAEPPTAATKMDTETAPLDGDEVKVKFTNSNQEAKVQDVEKGSTDGSKADTVLPALTKSQLNKYAKDPFWVRLRWGLFVLFWLAWLAMLVTAIVIIVLAPKCPTPAPKQWWQKAPVYEVYTKSFKDSDGDGVGDIQGVISKLDYIQSLGVGAVWMSPVYQSPMKDNGYDISDYKAIDPKFGSIDDFKDLVTDMHEKGLKLIMDFVPNHSSKQHEWFTKSENKEAPYTDYYVWAPGSPGSPPNNWKSVFGGSAWEYSSKRGEYYLHQFYKEQPDLNLRNPEVIRELTEILQFWLDLGVDGFRVDSVGHFFEDPALTEEGATQGTGYASVDHKYTYDQEEVVGLLKTFRDVLDTKTAEDEYNPRIMMTEAYLPASKLARYYGNVTDQIGAISHMPLNFGFMSDFHPGADFTAENMKNSIESYMDKLPDDAWSNFCLGNHDHSRAASRFGAELVDAMNMVTMILQGTPITYYGEEIGMVDGASSSSDARDPFRTPMQWNDQQNAGFTDGTPWLPVNDDYATVNVAAQEQDLNTHLGVYKRLAELRHTETVLFGSTQVVANATSLAIARIKKGNPGYLVIVNFGPEEVSKLDLKSLMEHLPDRGTISLRSSTEVQENDVLAIGTTVPLTEVNVPGQEAFIVTFVPNM